MTVAKVERDIASQLIPKDGDKDTIASWKQDLARSLQVFNVCLVSPPE